MKEHLTITTDQNGIEIVTLNLAEIQKPEDLTPQMRDMLKDLFKSNPAVDEFEPGNEYGFTTSNGEQKKFRIVNGKIAKEERRVGKSKKRQVNYGLIPALVDKNLAPQGSFNIVSKVSLRLCYVKENNILTVKKSKRLKREHRLSNANKTISKTILLSKNEKGTQRYRSLLPHLNLRIKEDDSLLDMEMRDLGIDLFEMRKQPHQNPLFKTRPLWVCYLLLEQAYLRQVYSHGLAHRDIKSKNIIVSSSTENNKKERLVFNMVDFDFAHKKDKRNPHTNATGLYAATELWGEKPILDGEKIDLYAWACVFYEILTGCDWVPENFDADYEKLTRDECYKKKNIEFKEEKMLYYYSQGLINGVFPLGREHGLLAQKTQHMNGFWELLLRMKDPDPEKRGCVLDIFEKMQELAVQELQFQLSEEGVSVDDIEPYTAANDAAYQLTLFLSEKSVTVESRSLSEPAYQKNVSENKKKILELLKKIPENASEAVIQEFTFTLNFDVFIECKTKAALIEKINQLFDNFEAFLKLEKEMRAVNLALFPEEFQQKAQDIFASINLFKPHALSDLDIMNRCATKYLQNLQALQHYIHVLKKERKQKLDSLVFEYKTTGAMLLSLREEFDQFVFKKVLNEPDQNQKIKIFKEGTETLQNLEKNVQQLQESAQAIQSNDAVKPVEAMTTEELDKIQTDFNVVNKKINEMVKEFSVTIPKEKIYQHAEYFGENKEAFFESMKEKYGDRVITDVSTLKFETISTKTQLIEMVKTQAEYFKKQEEVTEENQKALLVTKRDLTQALNDYTRQSNQFVEFFKRLTGRGLYSPARVREVTSLLRIVNSSNTQEDLVKQVEGVQQKMKLGFWKRSGSKLNREIDKALLRNKIKPH